VSRRGERAFPFCWDIQRRRQAMGVKVSDFGYRSYRAAQGHGNDAPDNFLNDLSRKTETKL
jgi:hypothetical protein